MHVLGIVLTVLIALVTLVSAIGKLTGMQQVSELLDSVGVEGPLRQALPFIQIAGAVGALLGLIALPDLGVAATAGLTLYYAGALGFHLRTGDGPAAFGPAAGLTVLALAATIVRALTI